MGSPLAFDDGTVLVDLQADTGFVCEGAGVGCCTGLGVWGGCRGGVLHGFGCLGIGVRGVGIRVQGGGIQKW